MCKEMPVTIVNKVVDLKRINGSKWRAEEEERQKGSLTPQKRMYTILEFLQSTFKIKTFRRLYGRETKQKSSVAAGQIRMPLT
jgi:hypothetical protein